jgi:hypothetical protein
MLALVRNPEALLVLEILTGRRRCAESQPTEGRFRDSDWLVRGQLLLGQLAVG